MSSEPTNEDDPYISFGKCFYDRSGDEAPSRYIPCGNVNYGHISCCESQDMCLSSNACYNAQFGVTYLAGCTDQDYDHSSCPAKDAYSGDAWVGLSYCNGTSEQWVACEANRGPATVTTAKPCWCPSTSRTVAFTDASRLADVVSLGTATGESIDWKAGFSPITSRTQESPTATTVPTPTEASTSKPTSATRTMSSTLASPTDSSSPASTSAQPTLATGAKIGIGIGCGTTAAIIFILICIVLRRRRKIKHNVQQEKDNLQGPPQPVTLYPNDPSVDSGLQSPCWSGNKSELDAIGTVASPSPRHGDFSSTKSEIEGSPGLGGEGRLVKDGGYEMPGRLGTVYEMPA